MAMTDNTASAITCPLCGADNQCAMAAGKPPESCWCFNTKLDEKVKAKAAAVTDAQCVCPKCGQVAKDTQP